MNPETLPNYTELAIGSYRDAIELAKVGRIEEANAQLRNRDAYAKLAIESYRKEGAK